MNNINISIDARNDSKVASIILMMLSSMEFETINVKRYNGIGVTVDIDGIVLANDDYIELLDVLRDLRKVDGLKDERIDVTVTVDVWGNEYKWGYFYDNNYDGNIFDEWGQIDMEVNY